MARANGLAKAAGFAHKQAAFDVRLNPAALQPAVQKHKIGVEDMTGNRRLRSGRWTVHGPCRVRHYTKL